MKLTPEEKLEKEAARLAAMQKPEAPECLDLQNIELPTTKEPVQNGPHQQLLEKGYKATDTFSKNVIYKLFEKEPCIRGLKVYPSDVLELLTAQFESKFETQPTPEEVKAFTQGLTENFIAWIDDQALEYVNNKALAEAEKTQNPLQAEEHVFYSETVSQKVRRLIQEGKEREREN